MFKNLKKKIEQGVAQSKAAVSGLTRGDDSLEKDTSSDFVGKPLAVSTPQKDAHQVTPGTEDVGPVFTTGQKSKGGLEIPTGQLVDIPLSEGQDSTHYETASDFSSVKGDETPTRNRSRTSSISSMTSENSFFPNVSFSHSYYVPSDVESEMEESSVNLSSVSKEDLYAFVKRFERRAFKYKSKFMELAAAYKDMMQEREKLKLTMAQCQDRAFRRMSELREQIHLDQLAKRDLEENYRLLLDEKDEYMKVLQMQVKLLKDGKEIPEELQAKITSKQAKAEAAPPSAGGDNKGNFSVNEEIELLKSKIKRQDGLLQKCKETITSYKEKVSQLSRDKQELIGKLQLTSKAQDGNAETSDEVSCLQAQIQEAKKVIEQLQSDKETAQTKQQQEEFEKVLNERIETAVEEQNKYWNVKMAAQEEAHNEILQSKDREREVALAAIEEEMRHKLREKEEELQALQTRELQKMAAVSGLDEQKDVLSKQIEELISEKTELNIRFTKLQEDSEHQISEIREKLLAREAELNRVVDELKSSYEAALVDEKNLVIEKTSQEIDLLKQRHAEEVQILLEKQEESLKESSLAAESQYKAGMEGVKEKLENLLSITKEQLEEMRSSYNQVQTKLADTEQLLATANSKLDAVTREHEAQTEELYAAINGKGEENENLRRNLEEIQSQLRNKERELEEAAQRLTQVEEEAVRGREQVESTQEESRTKCEQLILEREDLIQKLQMLTSKEASAGSQIKTLEESNLELRNQSQILFEELSSVRGELAASEDELRTLLVEKCKVREEFQQKLTDCEQKKEQSYTHTIEELEKQIKHLTEEHGRLSQEADNSKIRVEELEKQLENVSEEREAVESKSREFEVLVAHLQETVQTLESSCSSALMQKTELEEKLASLEVTIATVSTSKDELSETLHNQQAALIQKSAEEKQAQELKIKELTSEIQVLKDHLDELNKALSVKNDENLTLQSFMENNEKLVKSLETAIENLTGELQSKSQESENNKADFINSLERFEKLKNEADKEIKELNERVNSLTETLHQKQAECDEVRSVFVQEKDSLIKIYSEEIVQQREQMKVLEQTLNEKVNEKQEKYKEVIAKLRDDYENKLKEKDVQFEDRLKELTSQKDLGIEDLTKNLERLKEEQLRNQEQKHQTAVDEIVADWQVKYQSLNDEHSQKLQAVVSQYEQQINEIQDKLSSLEHLSQESTVQKDHITSLQFDLEDSKSQLEDISHKLQAEIENLNLELANRDSQVKELIAALESQTTSEVQQRESFTSQIKSLTEELHETHMKLESLTNTVSTEQECYQKQIAEQSEIAQELQEEKTVLSKQLEEAVEKHKAEVQEKDSVLNDVSRKLEQLEIERASVEEILTALDKQCKEKDLVISNLETNLAKLEADKGAQIHALEADIEAKAQNVYSLQDELQALKYHHEQELAELKENHIKEIDHVKVRYESQITQLSTSDAELQIRAQQLEAQVLETNEKLQESTHDYESRLEEERSKLERQETSLKEQINVLKQQLHDVQSQAEMSSNELQSSLQQKVKEGEERLLAQLESHREEIEGLKQEAEQNMRDLKQKYIVKLKEIQGQAKTSAEELQSQLQAERAAKEEKIAELNEANTHLLQLQESCTSSRGTIVDLETKAVEMKTLMESKESELTNLKTYIAENEKNMQSILEESQVTCQELSDKLRESESRLKAEESDFLSMQDQLQEKLLLVEQKNSELKDLERRFHDLEERSIQENEKYEHEIQEKDKKCLELEGIIQQLQESADSVQSEVERFESNRQHLQNELSHLTAEKKGLESELLSTKALLENSLEAQAQTMRELENRVAEEKLLCEQVKQDYESKISDLQQAHAVELSELSVNVEAQSSSKVAEYKKKAEAYISQVKKQLLEDKAAALDKQQENITRLQEIIAGLTQEITDLKQSQEKFVNTEITLENVKSEFNQELQLKQSIIEEFSHKEKILQNSESVLKDQVDSLLSEQNSLLQKLSVAEGEINNSKVQYMAEIEQLKSEIDRLQKDLHSVKTDKDEDLTALETKLEETVQKLQRDHETALEDQANEHASKVKTLVKEMNSQMAAKEREFEALFREAIDKSERNEQELIRCHQDDTDELRKEISERDERIEELHVEYKAKIQTILNEQLQSRLVSQERNGQIEDSPLLTKEAVLQNQAPITAFQIAAPADEVLLQQQIHLLAGQIERMKEQHKHELTEVQNSLELAHNSLSRPQFGAMERVALDASDPNFSLEMQDLELHNMDLQAQVSHLNGELSHHKIRERELLQRIEKLERGGKGKSDDDDASVSADGLYINHADSAIFREPTEFEYLKNILYEYMMGRETKTLAKVIASVVRFSDEQTRNVMARSETKLTGAGRVMSHPPPSPKPGKKHG